MQRMKDTFESAFSSKKLAKLKEGNFITEEQVRNYFLYDLQLDENREMRNLFAYLRNISTSQSTYFNKDYYYNDDVFYSFCLCSSQRCGVNKFRRSREDYLWILTIRSIRIKGEEI